MTTSFTTYAFPTTDAGTIGHERTMPDRLADIKNVKDFGATGDGVTDDWAAITAAVNWTTSGNRGIIHFPPGTYIVSQSIDYSNTPNPIGNIIFHGEIGLSTVVGNFADYVFRRQVLDTAGDGGVHTVEGLTVINNHATGGGIRIGYCVGAAVRDCIVTANLGINTASDDVFPGGVTSQEVAIENCTLRPGAHTSGSHGILSVSDGPIINCSIVGFDKGIIGWGQQGCQSVIGCHIELCGVGVTSGENPSGGSDTNAVMRISGCYFKNCGTAISGGTSMIITGICIEAATGTIAGDPQYGIHGSFGACLFVGITITGAFQQYGISLVADGQARNRSTFMGVQVTNTAGLGNWDVPSPAGSQFIGCNYAPVTTMAALPAFPVGINTTAWSGGVTTLSLFYNISGFIEFTMTITVVGATPSGYNGAFTGATHGIGQPFTDVSYSQSDPGSPTGSGGTAIINYNNNAFEGDCYNVSDANSATWGANPLGGGSNRAKVRWNGSNWAVVGI